MADIDEETTERRGDARIGRHDHRRDRQFLGQRHAMQRAGAEGGARQAQYAEQLRQQEFYGKPLTEEGNSLAGAAFARKSSLLIMGQAVAGEEPPLPTGLAQHLLDGSGDGNVGFMYVLTLAGADDHPLGALTLLRPQATGPLNHEQPNITEGLRRVLCGILEG